jgi:hypothetical protein
VMRHIEPAAFDAARVCHQGSAETAECADYWRATPERRAERHQSW